MITLGRSKVAYKNVFSSPVLRTQSPSFGSHVRQINIHWDTRQMASNPFLEPPYSVGSCWNGDPGFLRVSLRHSHTARGGPWRSNKVVAVAETASVGTFISSREVYWKRSGSFFKKPFATFCIQLVRHWLFSDLAISTFILLFTGKNTKESFFQRLQFLFKCQGISIHVCMASEKVVKSCTTVAIRRLGLELSISITHSLQPIHKGCSSAIVDVWNELLTAIA